MTGIAAVREWPLDVFGAAVMEFDHGADRILETGARAQIALGCDPAWTGATRDAATSRMSAHAAGGRRMVRTLTAVATAGRQAVADLTAARAALLQVADSAAVAGFTVADDGAVSHPDPRRSRDAGYLSQRIGGLLSQVVTADAVAASRLRTLAETLTGSGRVVAHPRGGWAAPADIVRFLVTMDQVARREYWDTLSAAEVRALVAADPKLLGSLDGVGFDARIAANDLAIRAALKDEVAAGRGQSARAVELRSMLEPVVGPNCTPQQRRFVSFDNTGHGRYIEVIGDLEPGVPGVGVFVPGTGSRLETSREDRRRAAELSAASGAPVLLYVDGRLPQRIVPQAWLGDGDPVGGTALDPVPARELGARLTEFGKALDAEVAATAPGAPTTYIGHSYGGSVVGTAQQYGLRADNVVFASSAGTGAGDGPWRDPNPDVHRYSLTPPGDPIHWAHRFGASVHGGDPDSVPGVVRLDSGRYSDGSPVQGWSSHSDYLDDPGSGAFRNIAAVLAAPPSPRTVSVPPTSPPSSVSPDPADELVCGPDGPKRSWDERR